MKRRNICPKCGSANLLIVPGPTDGGVFDNSIRTGATVFSAVSVDRYVCCDCTYTEEWVRQNDIPKLQKRYGGK